MKKTLEKGLSLEISPSMSGVSRKTIEKIVRTWQLSGNEIPLIRPEIPDEDIPAVKQQITDCINDKRTGDISRHAKSVHLVMIYLQATKEGKLHFLQILAENFDIDKDAIYKNIEKLKSAQDEKQKVQTELKLSSLLIPPRVKFLRKIISLPDGFIFLKDMRTDILPLLKTIPRLRKLDSDIKLLLRTYFDVNLLNLVEVTWGSPASLLEKLIQHEAVHAITSWDDLKHRLFSDRKVFAFLHPKMPNEPLIFVEVAFTNGLATSIQKVLDISTKPRDPKQMDTAIFYSISNAQKGLSGISFGNFLIKRVVRELRENYKNIKVYSTLSPIPTFTTWLNSYLLKNENCKLRQKERDEISKFTGSNDVGLGIIKILKNPDWFNNIETEKLLKKPLMRLCVYYLASVKRKGTRVADPVANFHLSNGAKIAQINWLGDISEKGIKESLGMMVNYKYKLSKIASNHEEYRAAGKVYLSENVKQLT